MCGLTGFLGATASARSGYLQASATALRHRGPDGEGTWNPEGPIGFAHRRLAIVDLSPAGAQPMPSADGRWVIAFNGEIYNHRQLREQLAEQCPVAWRGHSDTEVLVESIARFGVSETLRRCNGMFAIAAWDREQGKLWLARDRTGEKPLYVGWIGGGIAFASELHAMRVHSAWAGGVDEEALSWMLAFGYVPAPLSIHPGVYKVPAGCCLTLRPGDEGLMPSCSEFAGRLEHWWRLDELLGLQRDGERGVSDAEQLDRLDALLDDAVHLRMQADVPVAALLSGGIDSTLVVSSMVRRASGQRVRTFTVAFNEPGVDEAAHAAMVAQELGTQHEEIRCSSDAALALVERLPDIYDEPFADPAQIPAVLVSEAVRREVPVALTGDGGDELFEGYQRHLDAAAWWRVARCLGHSGRIGLGAGLRLLSDVFPPGSASRMSGRIGGRLGAADFDDYYRRVLQFPESMPDSPAMKDRWPHWPSPPSELHACGARMRFVDQMLGLPEGIHAKVDRASMSVGLEMRVPLLDPRIQAFSWRLLAGSHVGSGMGKRWLRALLARRMPGGIAGRRKQGFDVPIGDWLRGPLKPWAMDLLSGMGKAVPSRSHIEQVWGAHQAGRREATYALWAALCYLAWLRRHG